MQQRIVLDLRGKVPDLELEPSMHNRVVLVRPVVWRPTEGRLPCWPGSALALPVDERTPPDSPRAARRPSRTSLAR